MKSTQALALTLVGTALAVTGVVLYNKRRGGAPAEKLGRGFAGLGRTLGLKPASGRATRGKLGYSKGELEPGMLVEQYDRTMPIKKRVKLAQKLVNLSVKDPKMGPAMRKFALQLTKQCEARDGECEARAIYQWVKKHIRYTGDVAKFVHEDGRVEAVDYFAAAYKTLELEGGDCDDHSILVASLLILNGIDARFRITAPKGSREWSHIFPVAGLPKENPTRWVALDTTLPGGDHFGREAPFSRKIDFHV